MKRLLLILSALPLLAGAQQMTDDSVHSKYILAVDEFMPAPGQFINTMPEYEEGDTPETMVQKCTQYLAANQRSLVSLGGFGGYITFHFDHSIANVEGQRDFFIMGNAMQSMAHPSLPGGGSEPGIVMVSKDVNLNGLPDDPWYELSGSADEDSTNVVYNYEITYTRSPMQPVPWTDNLGRSGVVERNTYHKQEYYPEWLPSTLTFRGTLLPSNAIMFSKSDWFQYFLRDGYVDNKPNADFEANCFDIGRAVDAERKPVKLDFIDFVRVYSAMNQMCGWLGETSTEVQGAEDLHLEVSLEAIRNALSVVDTVVVDTVVVDTVVVDTVVVDTVVVDTVVVDTVVVDTVVVDTVVVDTVIVDTVAVDTVVVDEPDSIAMPLGNNPSQQQVFYSPFGERLALPRRGFNIVRFRNGKTRKLFVK